MYIFSSVISHLLGGYFVTFLIITNALGSIHDLVYCLLGGCRMAMLMCPALVISLRLFCKRAALVICVISMDYLFQQIMYNPCLLSYI